MVALTYAVDEQRLDRAVCSGTGVPEYHPHDIFINGNREKLVSLEQDLCPTKQRREKEGDRERELDRSRKACKTR